LPHCPSAATTATVAAATTTASNNEKIHIKCLWQWVVPQDHVVDAAH
jgi:hypothetical protein